MFSKVTVTKNVVYGKAVNSSTGKLESLKVDLYQPAGDTATARPVVVYAHGGAFTTGDKLSEPTPSVARELARRGFVVGAINYRLDGTATTATDDMQTAVRWFKAKAGTYRIDPARVAVMGSSSGAEMALEATFSPDDAASRVAGGLAVSWQVQSGISQGDPPIAVWEALNDPASPYALAEAMCQQTKLQGNGCEMYLYPTGGHGQALIKAHLAEVVQQASEFLCTWVLGPALCRV